MVRFYPLVKFSISNSEGAILNEDNIVLCKLADEEGFLVFDYERFYEPFESIIDEIEAESTDYNADEAIIGNIYKYSYEEVISRYPMLDVVIIDAFLDKYCVQSNLTHLVDEDLDLIQSYLNGDIDTSEEDNEIGITTEERSFIFFSARDEEGYLQTDIMINPID